MQADKSDLPQGTLDLLILKIVALGPVHGYAIAQRLQQVSRHVVQVPQGCVTPDYLKVMGMPLLDGRFFNDHDRMGSDLVVVIDEVFAKQAFGGESASWEAPLDSRYGIEPASSGGGGGPCQVLGAGGRRSSPSTRPMLLSVRPGPGPVLASLVRTHVDCRADEHRAIECGRTAAAAGARSLERSGPLRGSYHGATRDQFARPSALP